MSREELELCSASPSTPDDADMVATPLVDDDDEPTFFVCALEAKDADDDVDDDDVVVDPLAPLLPAVATSALPFVVVVGFRSDAFR